MPVDITVMPSFILIGENTVVVSRESVREISSIPAFRASEDKPWELRLHGVVDDLIPISQEEMNEAIVLFRMHRSARERNHWISNLGPIHEKREFGTTTTFLYRGKRVELDLHGLLHLRVLRDGVTVRAQYAVAVLDYPDVPLSAFIAQLRVIWLDFAVLGKASEPATSVATPPPYPGGGAPESLLL